MILLSLPACQEPAGSSAPDTAPVFEDNGDTTQTVSAECEDMGVTFTPVSGPVVDLTDALKTAEAQIVHQNEEARKLLLSLRLELREIVECIEKNRERTSLFCQPALTSP